MSRYRINPGELRHRITIQKLNNSQNEYGEVSELWEDILNVRAGIYPISGKEFFAAETVNSEITHKVKIRYIGGITPNMRIKFNNRIFSIESVINFQERNIEIQLLCKELI